MKKGLECLILLVGDIWVQFGERRFVRLEQDFRTWVNHKQCIQSRFRMENCRVKFRRRHLVGASLMDSLCILHIPVRSPRKRLLCHKREFEVDARANRGILRFLRPCMLRFVGDVGSG